MKRIRVGVLAGGASAERQISLATGFQIAEHLPKDRYEVVLLDPLALMANNRKLTDEQRAQARAIAERSGRIEALTERDKRELPAELQRQIQRAADALVPATSAIVPSGGGAPIDVAFIALHGPWGEDGTLQGLLEILGIPYVGSGVLASALAMDKVMAKRHLAAEGIDVARDAIVTRRSYARDPAAGAAAAQAIGYPVFVKPVQQGSSFGATLVERPDHLGAAIADALRYDDRAMIEERLAGTELTVGVIGGEDDLVALPVIEIVTDRTFFDYKAKYDPAASEEICPARVPDDVARRAQDLALRAHRALGCEDLSRTDMILSGSRMPVLEVNTIPGMTANSLLPKSAHVAGIPFGELLERLISSAMERAPAAKGGAEGDRREEDR
ncbi:MAG: D-alanine--D-alanine ligase [Chloroflexi bacterium]|nr:D-alanine--D-alanine ligase [Chloroflexota bacterium]